MLTRRTFFILPVAAAAQPPSKLDSRERVDRALKGADVDRPPFTFWHHFLLEKEPPEKFAHATLDFHRKFRTDLVKVMSDFPYPKDSEHVLDNPFPAQIRALEIIRDGLGGKAYFVETVFNPWNVLEKMTSKEEVLRLKKEEPQKLLDMLENIGKSEANHARKAVAAGASGIFLAIANAQSGILTLDDYREFSEPFDRMVLDAVPNAPLNTLHLHGDKVYLNHFIDNRWSAAAINYSTHGTGIPISDVRARYSGVIMGGLDEVSYRKLTMSELLSQAKAARSAAGRKFILAPGCSVPNDSADSELERLPTALKA
jgi:uroporphyrinogen decarboxylase